MPAVDIDWRLGKRYRTLCPEKILSRIERLPWSGCWIWMGGVCSNGYGIAYHGGQQFAHRLSYLIFVADPGDRWVLHACDTPLCVNPAHLHLGDHVANMREAVARRRYTRGSARSNSKLTEEKVREIKASQLSLHKLAELHGVGPKTIENIKAGRKWKHVV